MFDHLLESSRWDDSYKWSNIGFGEEMGIIELKIPTLSGTLMGTTFTSQNDRGVNAIHIASDSDM